MVVDLRSDTVTRPTRAMRAAMAEAEVGDDQYGEDPTVNALEEMFADAVGKEASVYLPSGTMGNQIALRVLTRPGDAVVAGARQHVVLFEHGAGPANAGITWLTIDDSTGALDPAAVELAARSAEYHQPRPAAVAVENTHMAAGGIAWPDTQLASVAAVAARHGLAVHLDGARLWNAAVATGVAPAALAAPATTVMCCLSKGLAAPVGSLLAGPGEIIAQAREQRYRFGGAMRQAGVIAAAGIVALREGHGRLAEDHANAEVLAGVVAERWPGAMASAAGGDALTLRPGPAPTHPSHTDLADPATPARTNPARTNMVLFRHQDPSILISYLESEGVLAGTVGPGLVRLVTHRDVDRAGVEAACKALAAAPL